MTRYRWLMQPLRRSWTTGMADSVLPIAGLIAMLLALAVLQLRWSTNVSEAERTRLQQNLQRSTSGFQSAFAQDLLGICQTLQASQTRDAHVLVHRLFGRYAVWRRISGNAALISDLYIWRPYNKQPNMALRLDLQTHKLEPVVWPESLRAFSTQMGTHPITLPRDPKDWLWDERDSALIHPIYAPGGDGNSERPQFFGYLLVAFNPRDFEKVYLPGLGRKYFPLSNGFVFQLVERADSHVVYQSDKDIPAGIFEHADAAISLVDSSTQYRAAAGPASPGMSASGELDPVLLSAAAPEKWQIAVRHRSGSVDAAVTSLRRRDLAVSIIVLLMLLVSLITILAATRRTRRLAKLQMEFASGVSHELRTPLAVIISAAENLADGVVTEGDRIREYGSLIHSESQRLSGMVDHILEFAQLDSHAHNYCLESVAATNLVEAVLENERPRIQTAGVSMDVNIPADLPMLLTNGPVLQQCLQNLLSNALKYGSGGRRILLNVSPAREEGVDQILICVEDFGVGIAAEDLSHIYEPFFRASGVRNSQIRGTGLGLSLTRKMMEGLHGRITAESSPGKGSAFTLHVPVAPSDGPPCA